MPDPVNGNREPMMDACEQAHEAFLDALVTGHPEPGVAVPHLAVCPRCANEFSGLRQTWQALGALPEVTTGDPVRARLLKRIRRAVVWESLCTWSGWVPAALAATTGVGLSLALALLVPYSLVVWLCQQLLQLSGTHVGPYVVAGAVYGLPSAAGAWVWRRQRTAIGRVIGTLEASALFLAILVPVAAFQCREFGSAQQAAFVWGLAGGAVVFGLAGLGLARAPLVRARP
jgi:hypothetical protein